MRDDALLREVLAQIVQAMEVLKAADVRVPMSLEKAACALHNELEMELPTARPMGQS
jgi:hypothetical protein